jgi:transposase
LSEFVSDDDFADLYPAKGKPALSPALLAMVTVFQFLETLSDRQAATMVVSRLDWKYALHLPLTYAGFDHRVLCEFRIRLVRQGAEARVFDRLLKALQTLGLLGGRQLQRSDSLAVVSAVRQLSRLELAMETLRLALNAIEAAEANWLRRSVPTSWVKRYGQWTQHERLIRSKGEAARVQTQHLLQQTGEDGQWLLDILTAASTPPALSQLPGVEILRRV